MHLAGGWMVIKCKWPKEISDGESIDRRVVKWQRHVSSVNKYTGKK